jgi:hypothetical protein
LRGADRKIVSHYDVTFAVADPNPESASARGPTRSLMASSAPTAVPLSYARDQLGFKTEMTYNLPASEVAGKWDWDDSGRAPASAAEDLSRTALATWSRPIPTRAMCSTTSRKASAPN